MIKLTSVCVEGFRLLESVEIAIEPKATVIVGRNNSGKTSLTEVFDRFLGEHSGQFRLEDFSASVRSKFISAKTLRDAGESQPDAVLAALPTISLKLTFSYDENAGDLGPLSPFIIDLDPTCTQAVALVEYSPSLATVAALLDIPEAEAGANPNEVLFRHLRDTIPKAYTIKPLRSIPLMKPTAVGSTRPPLFRRSFRLFVKPSARLISASGATRTSSENSSISCSKRRTLSMRHQRIRRSLRLSKRRSPNLS